MLFRSGAKAEDYSEPQATLIRSLKEEWDLLRLRMQQEPPVSDLWLVYGDELAEREEYNLAILAWHRALRLGHPRADVLRERLSRTRTSLTIGLSPGLSDEAAEKLLDEVDGVAPAGGCGG